MKVWVDEESDANFIGFASIVDQYLVAYYNINKYAFIIHTDKRTIGSCMARIKAKYVHTII